MEDPLPNRRRFRRGLERRMEPERARLERTQVLGLVLQLSAAPLPPAAVLHHRLPLLAELHADFAQMIGERAAAGRAGRLRPAGLELREPCLQLARAVAVRL